jgi:hypothetical protein
MREREMRERDERERDESLPSNLPFAVRVFDQVF